MCRIVSDVCVCVASAELILAASHYCSCSGETADNVAGLGKYNYCHTLPGHVGRTASVLYIVQH